MKLVETKGIDGPLDDIDSVLKIKLMADSIDDISGYYVTRNIQRMLALGVNPANLLKGE